MGNQIKKWTNFDQILPAVFTLPTCRHGNCSAPIVKLFGVVVVSLPVEIGDVQGRVDLLGDRLDLRSKLLLNFVQRKPEDKEVIIPKGPLHVFNPMSYITPWWTLPLNCIQLFSTIKGKEMFHLMMQSTHFMYGYMASDIWLRTISDSEKGNSLPPHRLLFPINSKCSFICTIPQTG